MELEANSRHGILERILRDENANPTDLPLSLLEDITNRFSLNHKIGSGGFAEVYKGIVGERMVAVKKLSRTIGIEHENKFHKEVECLMKAKHKNIIRFLGYCADAHGKVDDYEGKFVIADQRTWLLCFEYAPNGTLDKYISDASGGLEWKERFRIIKGICEGLHYLHKIRILHLDLKPANILLDAHMVPKITDFGLSRCISDENTHATTKHMSGTLGYLAPESYWGKLTFASDIYSLGVIIMEILTGVKGYPEDENVTECWMNRLEGKTQLEQVRVCQKIGIECMESDPKKRPVAWRIIDMLDITENAATSSMCTSLGEASLLEQSDQEGIGKLAESLSQEDINERPETEDVAKRSTKDEENTNDWSSWEAQDTERKDNNQETSIFRSVSSVLDKLNIFKILEHRKFVREGDRVLRNVSGFRIFTKREMKKITKNYSALIGRGSFRKVYKGYLPDNTIVAVNTSVLANRATNYYFFEWVHIQTQMVHMNILRLIGCCLESDVPMLVHEYAAKGSLQQILHGKNKNMLPLDFRLDIASGFAEGLRYMHSRGMRHGVLNPDNILFDDHLTPKIAMLKLSRFQGLPGFPGEFSSCVDYSELAYLWTSPSTEKIDVYSFGAVLLELLTRKKFVYNDYCNLIVEYRGRVITFDPELTTEEGDDVNTVLEEIGQLAIQCLQENRDERPDMTEVVERLMMIRRERRLNALNAS